MSSGPDMTEGWWRQVRAELPGVWAQMPDKWLLFVLLAAWLSLFHFVGNPTMGYVESPSLFLWLWGVYTASTVQGGVIEKLMDSDDGYCVLIPFLVVALFWSRRKVLLAVPRSVWAPGLVFLGLATALHVLGFLAQQPLVSSVALLGGLYALLAVVWGWRFAAASFFPFVLMAFCLPLGRLAEPITVPLRQVSADISVFFIRNMMGIPVLQQGVQIMDAKGLYHYEVAAACSGIRSLITLFALTTIYGFLTFNKPWKRLLMVGMTLPLSLAGNVGRLICIVVASEAFGRGAGEFVHNWFGFVTFAMALAVMFGLGHWLREETMGQPTGGGVEPAHAV
jgi:exosortase